MGSNPTKNTLQIIKSTCYKLLKILEDKIYFNTYILFDAIDDMRGTSSATWFINIVFMFIKERNIIKERWHENGMNVMIRKRQ
jgi:hypothetical protein